MYAKFQLAAKYLRYYISASNGRGHGIHSPFVFDFVIHVLNDKRTFYAYNKIEDCRFTLLSDTTALEIRDFGAGSVSGNTKKKTIASIAKHVAKPKKWGQLLFRIVNYYQPQTILELGTSLGLSAAYMSMGNSKAKLITCEGAPAISAIAKKNFASLGLGQIEMVTGNFDDRLDGILNQLATIDLIFIDGNHRKEPTLRYFKQLLGKKNDQTILIFDDIHWSKEMELAWKEIREHPQVMLTIDLFFIGLVFFRKEFKVKQHFVLRF
jgi:predicted O-methyltransferase YrrM